MAPPRPCKEAQSAVREEKEGAASRYRANSVIVPYSLDCRANTAHSHIRSTVSSAYEQSRANVAQLRQSRLDYGLGFQVTDHNTL